MGGILIRGSDDHCCPGTCERTGSDPVGVGRPAVSAHFDPNGVGACRIMPSISFDPDGVAARVWSDEKAEAHRKRFAPKPLSGLYRARWPSFFPGHQRTGRSSDPMISCSDRLAHLVIHAGGQKPCGTLRGRFLWQWWCLRCVARFRVAYRLTSGNLNRIIQRSILLLQERSTLAVA